MPDGEIKTEISADENANALGNPLFIQLSDGTGALSVTGGVLDVNATVTLETAYVDGAASFTVQVDKVNAQGFLVDDTATDAVGEGEIGLARMTTDRIMITDAQQRGTWDIGTVTTLTGITNDVSIDDGGNSITIDDGGSSITIDGTVAISGDVNVTATDLDIRDLTHVSDSVAIGDGTDTLEINGDGSINVVFGVASSGSEVHDYDTAASVAKGATDNHDYTVANTTFLCKRVLFGGSGRVKAEVQSGPLASLVTKAVRFTQRDTGGEIIFDPALPVPATSTGTLRVIRTQRSIGSLDVFSTIMGEDI